VADAATYGTELLVGLACLVLAVAMRRRPGPVRAVQIAFAVAGIAAVAHAAAELIAN
jgi:hypothetical protein